MEALYEGRSEVTARGWDLHKRADGSSVRDAGIGGKGGLGDTSSDDEEIESRVFLRYRFDEVRPRIRPWAKPTFSASAKKGRREDEGIGAEAPPGCPSTPLFLEGLSSLNMSDGPFSSFPVF